MDASEIVINDVIVILSEESDKPVTLDSNLLDLGFDSLDYVVVIQKVENHFHIGPIPDEDFLKLSFVWQIVNYIEGWKSKQKVNGGVTA